MNGNRVSSSRSTPSSISPGMDSMSNMAINAPRYGISIPNRIFVGGIDNETTEAELQALFSNYGRVKAAKIINDRAGVSRGYGFVTFENGSDAKRVLKEADNLVFKNKKLNIAVAIKKQPTVRNDVMTNGSTLVFHPVMNFPYPTTPMWNNPDPSSLLSMYQINPSTSNSYPVTPAVYAPPLLMAQPPYPPQCLKNSDYIYQSSHLSLNRGQMKPISTNAQYANSAYYNAQYNPIQAVSASPQNAQAGQFQNVHPNVQHYQNYVPLPLLPGKWN